VTRKIKYREKRNENLVKYRRQKRRAYIFTSVIDIPFSGNIFYACQIAGLGTFVCKLCIMEEGMMWECGSKFVYRRGLGVVCRPQNNGSAI
jgi:hypothetical protein